jgi:hypothetical protein
MHFEVKNNGSWIEIHAVRVRRSRHADLRCCKGPSLAYEQLIPTSRTGPTLLRAPKPVTETLPFLPCRRHRRIGWPRHWRDRCRPSAGRGQASRCAGRSRRDTLPATHHDGARDTAREHRGDVPSPATWSPAFKGSPECDATLTRGLILKRSQLRLRSLHFD